MKKLIVALLALGIFSLSAQTTTVISGVASAQHGSIPVPAGARIKQFTITDTTGSANTIKWFSSPDTNHNYGLPARTTVSVTVTSQSDVFTNVFGNLYTNTYNVLTKTTNSVSSNLVNYPIIFSTTLAANGSMSIDFNDGVYIPFGIASTNGAASSTGVYSYLIEYEK